MEYAELHRKVNNDLINYSKAMVEQINHAKGEVTGLEYIQCLVFAGMLSYYGMEHINDIYLAFLWTNFVRCSTINEVINSKYSFSKKDTDKFINHCPGTFYEACAIKNLATEEYKIARKIYVTEEEKFASSEILKSIIHQMNHVINSIHDSILLTDDILTSRMGLSLDEFSSRCNHYLDVEEAINRLQTDDIMWRILDFLFYEIDDKEIGSYLDSIIGDAVSRENGEKRVAEDTLGKVIKPLYDNEWFNTFLVDKRISGKIGAIRDEFDSRTVDGCFINLLGFCDEISKEDAGYEEKAISEGCAKMLIKRYITSFEEI